MFIIYLWIFGLNSSFLNRELDLSKWFNTLKNSLSCVMAALNTQIIYIYIYIQTLATPLDVFLKGLELHALLILPSLSLMWPKYPAQVKDMQSSDVLIKLSKLHMVVPASSSFIHCICMDMIWYECWYEILIWYSYFALKQVIWF